MQQDERSSKDDDIYITPQGGSYYSNEELPDFGNDIVKFLEEFTRNEEEQESVEVKRHAEEHRFGFPLDENEVEKKIKQSIPKATLYKDAWAVRMFEEWRCERNMRVSKSMEGSDAKVSSASLEEMSNEMLNKNLSLFIIMFICLYVFVVVFHYCRAWQH